MCTKDTYLSAQGRRLTHRRGKKRAVVGVAHTILMIAFHLLERRQPYQDLGSNYFDERERTVVARQSVRRLEQLGFKVTLETSGEAAWAPQSCRDSIFRESQDEVFAKASSGGRMPQVASTGGDVDAASAAWAPPHD